MNNTVHAPLYDSNPPRAHSRPIPAASPSPSLLDLPDDMIFVIIKRVGRDCYRSFVNAKVACKTFKRISEEPKVIQEIAINQIPLFHEERDEKFQEVIDACLDGGFFFRILIFFSILD